LLLLFQTGAVANVLDICCPISGAQYGCFNFSEFFKRHHHFLTWRLSCNGTSIFFADSDYSRRTGQSTRRQQGLNKAMPMPVAGVKNHFVWRGKWSIHSPKMSQGTTNNGHNGNGESEPQLRQLKKIAPAETAPMPAGVRESLITFKTGEAPEMRGVPTRVTRHAVVFELYHPAVNPRLSEVLNEFKIVLKDRTVYSGRAVVRNVVDAGLRVICEATLNEANWLDVDPDWAAQGGGRLAREFRSFLDEWQKLYRVLPEYKIITADMQTFFADLRLWLDQVEAGFRSLPAGSRRQREEEVTRECAQTVIPSVNELFKKFEAVAERIEADQRPAHESYLRQHLHSLVLCAPFAHRTFYKPLGYAGDYEMVNMIARDGQDGDSLYAKVVNCWFLNQPPAAAHRNRLTYLAERMEAEALRTSRLGHKARIFNFACGPAVEVQRFLGDSLLSEEVELTLADFNRETLDHVAKVIRDIKERCHRQTAVQVQKQTVHQWLKENLKTAATGGEDGAKYDFVYCSGLFDYLSDHTCAQLMDVFYDQVAPGGLLLVTNVDPSNPLRNGMAYLLDWHLIYRTAPDLRTLRPERAPDDAVQIRADATGVNLFMEVRKPNHD
jgi:extracellular factor (EF) 3-hydroxypalmitic acid methyl ester biosynthesis protein